MFKQALGLLLPAALTFVVAGCSASTSPVEVEAQVGTTKQAIVGGAVSTTAQDSVVYLKMGEGSCTGTLIAPNLVLTARHCVAQPPSGSEECGEFTSPMDPSDIVVKTGVSAGWETGTIVGKGKKLFQPTTNSSCGHDAALIQLDKDVPNAKISPVRFTPLKKGEATTAVGYGIDQNEKELPKRMQRNTTILGIGPSTVAYKMKDGKTFTYEAPEGDVVTGESTCSGDSGGPLFDSKGAVVAMTSRGPMDGPTGGSHGKTGCGDMVAIYASTIANEEMIRSAAEEAGHPLDGEGTLDPQTTDQGDDDDDSASSGDDDDDDSAESDDDDDDKKSSKKTTKKSTGTAAAAGGCSSTPGQTSNAGVVLLGLGLAMVRRRRR